MPKLDLEIAKFKCQICNKKQTINVKDESTYQSKTTHEEFFGMKLETYRSVHVVGNEKHVNVVLIDQKGLFRGYIDSYKEDLSVKTTEKSKEIPIENLMVLGSEIDTIEENNQLNCFILIKNNSWIMEVVRLRNLSIKEISRMIMAKIEESKKVYIELPKPLRVTIADLDFHIFIKKDFISILSFKNKPIENIIQAVEMLTDRYFVNPLPPRKRALKLIVRIFSNSNKADFDKDLVFRLLTDDLLYTYIRTKYQDRIPQIAKNISRRYKVSKESLVKIIQGEATVIDILEQEENCMANYQDLIEIVDYINRRKLLS